MLSTVCHCTRRIVSWNVEQTHVWCQVGTKIWPLSIVLFVLIPWTIQLLLAQRLNTIILTTKMLCKEKKGCKFLLPSDQRDRLRPFLWHHITRFFFFFFFEVLGIYRINMDKLTKTPHFKLKGKWRNPLQSMAQFFIRFIAVIFISDFMLFCESAVVYGNPL